MVWENCCIFAVRKTTNVSPGGDTDPLSAFGCLSFFVYHSSMGDISSALRFATLHLCLIQYNTSDFLRLCAMTLA